MHYKAIIISPHLDDAVFTCGGRMTELIKEGPVLVLNIFTHYLGEVKDRAIVMADDRFDEERDASLFLGYTRYNFGELEAYFRRKPYQELHNIFHPPVAEDCGEYLTSLRERIFSYLDALEYDELYIPLGIGWHVDHILTFTLFEPWIGKKNITFYEDIPYALVPYATQYRLSEIGAYSRSTEDTTLLPKNRLFASFISAYAYFKMALMRNLKPPIMRYIGTLAVWYYFYQLMSLHKRMARLAPDRYLLEPLIVPVDDFSHKIEAMALYWGQFQEFFIDPADCRALYATYAQSISGNSLPIERFWKINLRS